MQQTFKNCQKNICHGWQSLCHTTVTEKSNSPGFCLTHHKIFNLTQIIFCLTQPKYLSNSEFQEKIPKKNTEDNASGFRVILCSSPLAN